VAPHVTLLVPALGIAVAAAIGAADDLERFAAALQPFTGHHVVSGVGAITYGGPVELWLGVAARHLGDLDRAIERLQDATVRCATNGARGYQVEAQAELVAALTERGAAGDAERAREVAARAIVSARELDMAPFLARLESWSTQPDPTASAADDGGLTRRQLEVAELVAQGLTNREIAERLTLSERTAENHIQHIMIKLGVPNRSGIAVWWVTRRKMSTPVE
jgi:DNA-binding CsgD family transcriptional regulator